MTQLSIDRLCKSSARNAFADGKKNDAKLMKINCLIKVTATPIGLISFAIMSVFDHHVLITNMFNSDRL